jgi:CelD/BcsL family acetyltransferase involved in cellulose biosynthesis
MTLDVRLTRLEEPARLAVLWQELEARADASFFQSWLWIGAWLDATGARPLVLSVHEQGRLVGLGLLSERRLFRYGLLPVRQLLLSETGRHEQDRLTIEYNGVMLARDIAPDTLARLLRALDGNWQELVLSGVPDSYAAAAEAAGLQVEFDRRSPCYAVDLAALRISGQNWFQTLSANSRGQIRRAMRQAGRVGSLAIAPAATVVEALGFFDEMVTLHQSRWQSKGEAGAFGTVFERNFHHHLISLGVESGRVQLVRVTAGTRVVGYLYNFVHRQQVMNYQGGFAYEKDNRDRPGLVAHALCIGMADESGFDRYNLLAGDSRYKRSLGRCDETLIWCRVQRPRLAFSVERAARRIKQWAERNQLSVPTDSEE